MEKRMIIAMVLSMAVLIATQYYFRMKNPVRPAGDSRANPVPGSSSAKKVSQPAQSTSEPAPAEGIAKPLQGTKREIEVDRRLYRAIVSTEGATFRSFRLKDYRDRSGQPLELLPQSLPDGYGHPGSVVTGDPEVDQRANSGLYALEPAASGPALTASTNLPLRLAYRDDKVYVMKTFSFSPDQYAVGVEIRLQAYGQPRQFRLSIAPALVNFTQQTDEEFLNRSTVAQLPGGSIERQSTHDLEQDLSYQGAIAWAGLSSKYFSALGIPDHDLPEVQFHHSVYKTKDEKGNETEHHWADPLLPSRGPLWKGTIFYGPNDPEALRAVKPELGNVIDYGWFSFLIKPLLAMLKLIQTRIHNWGWAIIVLTFLINLALFPIRHKQTVSMKRMQVLQPKVKAIQEKYKKLKLKPTDPKKQQMNVEIMNLYKENKVNPLGGCLPLLVQMPFLIAFYKMLDVSIELRGAPFALWIRDLSKHDPTYITPILMGALMVWQQKMTPTATMDPTQAKMMMLMPIIFTAMFLTVSSGLVLYMLFSSIFAMAFQWLSQQWDPSLKVKV